MGSATTINIRSPNYEFDTVKIPKPINELSIKELELIKEKIEKQKKLFEDENQTGELQYTTIVRDLNATKLAIRKKAKPVEEPKVKVLTDNIKTVGNWNNVFEANKNNEDVVDQLTNFNLEDLIAKENNVTVLNQAKNKLYQTKALGDNTVAKSNIQLVQGRIAELKGEPVEEVAPVKEETALEAVLEERKKVNYPLKTRK